MILLIPKENSRIRGRRNWREIIRRFMGDPMNYLKKYFRRNASGSGFSSNKRTMAVLYIRGGRIEKKHQGSVRGSFTI